MYVKQLFKKKPTRSIFLDILEIWSIFLGQPISFDQIFICIVSIPAPECRKVECRTEFDCDSSVPEMCDTSTNKCVEVECRGNDFCTETAYPDACKNGKCKCKVDGLDAKCTRVKCMNNSHCDSSKKEVCNGKSKRFKHSREFQAKFIAPFLGLFYVI